MKKIGAILALFAFLPSQLFSWSAKGHAIIADIASTRLTPITRQNVKLLLGDDTLGSVASWADDVRKDRDATYGWHFVSIPKSSDGFSDSRDCFHPDEKHPSSLTDHQNCVVDRIEMFEKIVTDENASRTDRVEALKFLVHFVGDIHQPLHAIDEARGGNDIKVTVFGSGECGKYPCNLHGVWDYSLVEHAGYPEDQYARHLQGLIQTSHLEEKAAGRPEDWANESFHDARKILAGHGDTIDDAYYQANIALVDERLALAGIRLAALLNGTLGKIPTKKLEQDLKQHS
jgi:hypothetical protein